MFHGGGQIEMQAGGAVGIPVVYGTSHRFDAGNSPLEPIAAEDVLCRHKSPDPRHNHALEE